MANGVKMDVQVKEDGVYLCIEKEDEFCQIERDDMMKVIEENRVEGIDFEQINNVLSSDDLKIEKKIGTYLKAPTNEDKVVVEISKDRMEAKIKFIKVGSSLDGIPEEKITKALEDAGVRYGIMEEVIKELTLSKYYDTPYLIATGTPSIEGKDGFLDLNFDNSSKTYKPKIMENGKADYRELELVKTVNAGQLLATSIPPVVGTDGMNVLGQVVAAKQGRPAPALPSGKNVISNDSGTELYAASNGQIIYDGNKISVSPILELPGNIDNKTGNVNFNGAVVIKGSVLSGFSVIAEGNIEVLGVVEGALLKSDSHIFLYSGVKGADKAVIQAKGDITVKYAENCTMEAGRNIIASCIIHSNVTAKGYLEVSGKNGSLVGGKTKVTSKIEAVSIGSPMAAVTDIEVGINPDTLEKYRVAMNEFNRLKSEYGQIEKLVVTLTELNKKSLLDDQKKSLLLKSIHTKLFIHQKLDEVQKQINELMPELSVQKGTVMAREVVFSGVKLLIGNAIMYVRDDIRKCILKNVDGRIVVDRI